MLRQLVTTTIDTSIASGGTTSDPIYTEKEVPVAIRVPSAVTGANLSFLTSPDGGTYQQLYVGGAAYSVPIAASKDVPIVAGYFAAFPYLKIVSDATEGAARTFTVITRKGDM